MTRFSADELVKVIPLGGLGHIGGNMMAFETAEDLLLVDCGVLFATIEEPGVDYIIPDIHYVLQRSHKLRAIILTHGHEDHIGALPFVLPQLPRVPLYATAFTSALIRSKLNEHRIDYDLHLMADRQVFQVGDFAIDPIPVTHSIPHCVALALRTPAGIIIHTADFKLDPSPIDGRATDVAAFKAYGDEGIELLLSDSTNADRPGYTWSEQEVARSLAECIHKAPHRVLVTTFASHLERIQAVLSASEQAGRQVVAMGRSMQQNIQIGLNIGYLQAKPTTLLKTEHFAQLPRHKAVILLSGSQGEPQSAMYRLAHGQLRDLWVDAGDCVIFSSRRIPGNEKSIAAMMNQLCRQGAEVITDHVARVHSSGHGFAGELEDMLSYCRPRHFIPLHGEYRHMQSHVTLAIKKGLHPQNALILEDGQSASLQRQEKQISLKRGSTIQAGLIYVDGTGIGDVNKDVLKERHLLAAHGVVICEVVFDVDGEVLVGPFLQGRGLSNAPFIDKLLRQAEKELARVLDNQEGYLDMHRRNDILRQAIRRFFKQKLGRKPLVILATSEWLDD